MNKLFPGMDPYLEAQLSGRISISLSSAAGARRSPDVLPEPYEARLDETIQLLPMSEEVIQPGS
jgi:hypothetical protein